MSLPKILHYFQHLRAPIIYSIMATIRLLHPFILICLHFATRCALTAKSNDQPSDLQAYQDCTQLVKAPRVALLFLVKQDLIHRELWRQWLQSVAGVMPIGALLQASNGGDEKQLQRLVSTCNNATAMNSMVTHRQFLFSLVMHIPPRHDVDPTKLLGNELLADRIDTNWGGTDLVDATRRMLQFALEEPLNKFFVLLSESTIPLYPPLVVYEQLLHRSTSAVNACPWPQGEAPDIKRYVEKFQDTGMLTRTQWRKSCQYFGLLREHALVVASNNKLWSTYQERCPGSTPCVADEHYVPLVLSMHNLEDETDCHGHLTFTNWTSRGNSPMEYTGSGNTSAPVLSSLRAGQGDAVAHCHTYASQPPPVDLRSFVFLSQSTARNVVDAAQDVYNKDLIVAAPSVAMHPHCPMFARKFPEAERDRLLRVLQQHPMDVLPEATLPMRRYNANNKRGKGRG